MQWKKHLKLEKEESFQILDTCPQRKEKRLLRRHDKRGDDELVVIEGKKEARVNTREEQVKGEDEVSKHRVVSNNLIMTESKRNPLSLLKVDS